MLDNGDDEGNDHHDNTMTDNYCPSRRPQHQHHEPSQHHHATPHDEMTSILSAAGYSPPKAQRKRPNPKHNAAALEESATKKALRKRALRHFHRGGSNSATVTVGAAVQGGGANGNANSASSVGEIEISNVNVNHLPNNNPVNIISNNANNSNVTDATTALATTTTIIVTPNIEKQQQQQAADPPLHRPPTHNNSNRISITIPNNPTTPSTSFFPRTAISSKTSPNTTSSSSTNTFPSTNNTNATLQSTFQNPSPTFEYNDPILQRYPSSTLSGSSDTIYETQSNATSGYNSGSDLENAARRILRGKKNRSPSPVGVLSENKKDGPVSSGGADRGSNSGNGGGGRSTLPTGWRERIERKTGMQLPKMAESKTNATVLSVAAETKEIVLGLEKKMSRLATEMRGDGNLEMTSNSRRSLPVAASVENTVLGQEEEQEEQHAVVAGLDGNSSFPREEQVADNEKEQTEGNDHHQVVSSDGLSPTFHKSQSQPFVSIATIDYSYYNQVENGQDVPVGQQYPQPGRYQNDGQNGRMSNNVNSNLMAMATADDMAIDNNNNEREPPAPLQLEYNDQYYPENLVNNSAFPNYSTIEGRGGQPTIHHDSIAQHGHGNDGGYHGYPPTPGTTPGAYHFQHTNRHNQPHHRNQPHPTPLRNQQHHNTPLPPTSSYILHNNMSDYDYHVHDDEANSKMSKDYRNERYQQLNTYQQQQWDSKNNISMDGNHNNGGGGNGWGDAHSGSRPFDRDNDRHVNNAAPMNNNAVTATTTIVEQYQDSVHSSMRFIPISITNNHNEQEQDDDFPKTPNTNDLMDFVPTIASSIINKHLLSLQHAQERRAHFSSSVQGDADGIDDLDDHSSGPIHNSNDGFNDQDYFHCFTPVTSKGTSNNGTTLATNWEEIPPSPMIQWNQQSFQSTCRKKKLSSSPDEEHRSYTVKSDSFTEITDFDEEVFDEDSAWSSLAAAAAALKPKSNTATASLSVGGQSTAETMAKSFDPFGPWKENDGIDANGGDDENDTDEGGGVSSSPQWKLRQLLSVDMESVSLQEDSLKKEKKSPTTTTPQQPVYAFSDEKEQTQQQTVHPFSDNDASDRGYEPSDAKGTPNRIKSRSRGLKFFRSKNRKYNSEGERSDTSDWESADDRSSKFSLSPLRGRKKKKKKGVGFGGHSKSPRRMSLFGQRQYTNANANEAADEDAAVDRKYASFKAAAEDHEPPLKPNEAAGGGNAAIETVCTIASFAESENKDAITEPSGPVVDANLNDSMMTQRPPPTVSKRKTTGHDQQPEQFVDEQSLTGMDSANLNESRDTQATPVVSNGKGKTRVVSYQPKQKPWKSSSATTTNNTTNKSPRDDHHDPRIEKAISKDQTMSSKQSETPSGTTVQTEFNEDDSISTLGSLVTKGTMKSRRNTTTTTSSDMSTATELSEIERLRKENVLLREELENASQLSSKVSSLYAASLKLENRRMREELKNASPSHLGMNVDTYNTTQKFTLENLFDNDIKKQPRKSRRRAAVPLEAITDFNHLPPVAHLINGVDFDDDSISTYTPIELNKDDTRYGSRRVKFEQDEECETPDGLMKKTCSRIATTTRSVASQMKTVAQDLNNDIRMKNSNEFTGSSSNAGTPMSRPLDCFNSCARRRDRRTDNDDSMHTTYMTRKKTPARRRKHHQSFGSSVRSSVMMSTESSTTGSLSQGEI